VTVRELPGRVFQGKVTRTAGAIDPTSRTLLTEVQVPNPDGLLLSGSYATVRFQIRRVQPPLVVPQSALLIDGSGVRVGVVADGTIHYRPIQIGRDFGTEVEVLAGLDTSDVLLPRGTVARTSRTGSRVDVAKPSVQAMTRRVIVLGRGRVGAAGCMVLGDYHRLTSRPPGPSASTRPTCAAKDGATSRRRRRHPAAWWESLRRPAPQRPLIERTVPRRT
jgi:hypothetical protein